jgi:Bacterial protein of unknown function (DUF853)
MPRGEKKMARIEKEALCSAKEALEGVHVAGRGKEIEKICRFLESPKKRGGRSICERKLYVYGRPGTGKTHTLKKIAEQVSRAGFSPVYLNVISGESAGSPEKGRKTFFVVDEYDEGYREEYMAKRREILEKSGSMEIRSVFISNRRAVEGIHFRQYTEDELEEIASGENFSTAEKIKRIRESMEKGDLRALFAPASEPQRKVEGSREREVNHYHKFVKQQLLEGITEMNAIYGGFIEEMRKKGIPVLSRESVSSIKEIYEQ